MPLMFWKLKKNRLRQSSNYVAEPRKLKPEDIVTLVRSKQEWKKQESPKASAWCGWG